MATPRENLLSVEHLTGMEQNTFTKQRSHFIEKSRGMQLQQHLEELKERERKAHHHNRQLLLQFERAQGTLREMLARNAAMKIIRMEYERYLDENLHRWQQQLLEKTQASQRKRMEDCLNSRQNKDQVSTATVGEPLISKDPYMRSKTSDAPQTYMEEKSADGENNSSDYPHPGSSWLTQAGMVPGFLRAPFQPQTSSLFPPPNFPYSHLHLLPNLPSSPAHHQPCSRAEAAGWDPPCYNEGFSRGSAGQLHSEEPSVQRGSQTVEENNETNLGISKRVRGGEVRRRLSTELDIKPVRLSSGHAETSESDRDSSLTSREKKTKKGKTKPSSSESERSGSQKSSRTSSKIIATLSPVAVRSETNSSSEEGGTLGGRSRKRGKGLRSGSVTPEKEAEELNRSKEDKMTEDESDSEVIKSEEVDDEEGNSSEQSNTEERDEEDEEENSGSEDGRKENKGTSEEGSNVEEDEEENNDGEEVKGGMEDEEDEEQLENRKQDSASSLEEEEEENGGSEKEEEQEGQLRSDEAGDSEDSIITPHDNRSKQMRNIPKEAAEDEEEESNSQSLNNSKESSDEDIENLLAPQEPTNKTANTVKSEGNPKAKCLNLDIFQVAEASVKTDHKSDSDEFDHFYD
ncbi:midasin-like isoform X2 [Cyprinodon tularosa]|uniref:midasin-like isoform X2 n=1 Tax=Cyprinodon tularosa TaxID=77115 RepID=UPI0018E2361A|nr:midasin-like isoform X2 [Cyprinodon tularosa]